MIAARHRAHRNNRNGKLARFKPAHMVEFITMARKPGGKNNGITHGACAKDLLLPGECPEEFELLHRGLIEDWNPTGTLENEIVLDLAQYFWQKRRVERFYHEEAMDSRFQNAEMRLVIYLADGLDQAETLEQATPYISKLPELYKGWIEQEVPRSKFGDDKSWLKCLKRRIRAFAMQNERFARATLHLTGKTHRSANLRELTAKKIAVQERLDAGIDRAIKRLAQLKTFKQIVAEQASRPKIIDQRNIANHRPQTSTN
jgi:hypothetical protein